MIIFLIFIAEIILLFLFSRSLTNSLARLLYKISRNKGFTYNVLAVIFLPGTIIHEIAHMLIAGIMFVPSGDMEIFPQIEGDEVRFGSVKIAESDPIRRFIIGVAPVIFGLILMFAVLIFSLQFFNASSPWWQIALVVFLVFEISNTMFSSSKDMEGALVLFLVIFFLIAVFLASLYFTNNLSGFLNWINSLLALQGQALQGYFKNLVVLLLIPLGIDLVFIIPVKILKI